MNIYAGDIGEDEEEVEVMPLEQPLPEELPATPVPEEVPA